MRGGEEGRHSPVLLWHWGGRGTPPTRGCDVRDMGERLGKQKGLASPCFLFASRQPRRQ